MKTNWVIGRGEKSILSFEEGGVDKRRSDHAWGGREENAAAAAAHAAATSSSDSSSVFYTASFWGNEVDENQGELEHAPC
eukprot:760679-Hanusia_phi.AAC.5